MQKSFSSVIKNELGRIDNTKPCCAKAETQIADCLRDAGSKWPNISNRCCKKAVLRGAFLLTGSVSDPEKSYHLEITCKREDAALFLSIIMNSFGLNPKVIYRNDHYVVYIKEGEGVVDFLNITGAHSALMSLENVRIVKDMRNSVNRIVNCETANLDKLVNASVRQIQNIKYIEENIGFANVPPALREIARLRLDNSAVSLKELGLLLDPPLGKSGVNHRLRKLDGIAEAARASELQSTAR